MSYLDYLQWNKPVAPIALAAGPRRIRQWDGASHHHLPPGGILNYFPSNLIYDAQSKRHQRLLAPVRSSEAAGTTFLDRAKKCKRRDGQVTPDMARPGVEDAGDGGLAQVH